MPNMPPEIALIRSDQWRATFAQEVVTMGEFLMQSSISIGMASYPAHGETFTELTRCADVALYRAKSEGRNRVVLYHPDMDSAKS
jgi:diguanylate cyclase